MSKTINDFPTHIVLTGIGEQGFSWSGQAKLRDMSRLYAESVQDDEETTVSVEFNLAEDKRSRDLYKFTSQANTHISLVCQRCLEVFVQKLNTETDIILSTSAELECLLDEDEEMLCLTEDADFDLKKGLQVQNLIEDELLLVLPISPKHDDCELAVTSCGEIPEEVEEEESPFSALAALKGKL